MVRKTEWKQKDGTVIKIKDMDDNHLRNTIRLMNRKGAYAKEVQLYRGYVFLGGVQGEMAQDSIEQGLRELDEATPEELAEEIYPMYDNMLKEADKRKLEVV